MNPKPNEIYLIKARWRNCTDIRPCVVIELRPSSKVLVALISAQLELFRDSLHFRLDDEDGDFLTTGLSKSSFVAGDQLQEVAASSLVKLKGTLSGDMARSFVEWIG